MLKFFVLFCFALKKKLHATLPEQTKRNEVLQRELGGVNARMSTSMEAFRDFGAPTNEEDAEDGENT